MWLLLVVYSVLSGAQGANLDFPPLFKFGAATASYQVEGGWNVSDKGISVWDHLAHTRPDLIYNGDTGDVACDSYNLWETDVEIAANMSLHFYRFSLSWPRLLPSGFTSHKSEDGKEYYNKLIDGLLAKNIEPVVTLFHWDLPQRLQDLGGWLNPYIVDWFADYADYAFSLYGDRVKTWITINEPTVICDCTLTGTFRLAPAIIDPDVAYICTKHVLLAHAKAYRLYDEKYRTEFQGLLSIANHAFWFEGLTEDDSEYAELAMQFGLGRYARPIYSKEGGWPPVIEKIVAEKSKSEGFTASKLPPLTKDEIELIKGTYDFFAFNHYTGRAVRKALPGEEVQKYPFQGIADLGLKSEGRPEWKPATSTWLLQYPEGLRKTLSWIKKEYGDVPILITENGYSSVGGDTEDYDRIKYYHDYLEQVLLAIHEDGVNMVGYTAWTLIDNFEWMDGYRSKFGLYEVDFSDPKRTRTPRKSALYYRDVIKSHSLDVTENDKYIRTEL